MLAFDCETTGTLYYRHCIHQLAGAVLIDGKIAERFDFKIRPHEKAEIEDTALKVSGVTREQIMEYPHRTEQFGKFLALLQKYVDPYKADQKFFMLGYNISWFDCEFLRNLFILQENHSFGCYFWNNPVDIMVLSSYFLMPDRHLLPTFRLSRVAKYLGIPVLDDELHNAEYDVDLMLAVYEKVKGKTIDDW